MSDVVDFKRPTPPAGPAKPPKSRFGDDDNYLKWCAEWRASRAQQQKNWAEHNAATMWGTTDKHIELDTDPLDRMHQLEWHLAMAEPRTMLLARELLGIAITILAHGGEDPDATLAQGPVLDIVRNVVKALDFCKADMRVGPKRGQDAD
jgi:hypothetical protein